MSNEIKGNVYKHMNEFKKDTNKQLDEIRKTPLDIKEEFQKE
jgi:hypothetical protein